MILIALVLGAVLVPRSKDPEEQPLDLVGALLSIVGLVRRGPRPSAPSP